MFSGLTILTLIALAFILGVAFGRESGSSDAFLRGYRTAEDEYATHRDSRGRFVKR